MSPVRDFTVDRCSAFAALLAILILVCIQDAQALNSPTIKPTIASKATQTAKPMAKTSAVKKPFGHLSFVKVENLQPGAVKTSFETKGRRLINNLNLVAVENGKPALIRGGGFTPESLDWLINQAGVRRIIDLRGNNPSDFEHRTIALNQSVIDEYTKANKIDRLKNMGPIELKAYIAKLNKQTHKNIAYLQVKADDPKLLAILQTASSKQPTAMFCLLGKNRSGTAWARMAYAMGWPKEKAYQHFGVYSANGEPENEKDIDWGYRVQELQTHPELNANKPGFWGGKSSTTSANTAGN